MANPRGACRAVPPRGAPRLGRFPRNHISARIPGAQRHFLLNPLGLWFDEVTASNLVKIDLDGNIIDGEHGINYAGFVIHSAIHAAREDAQCVLHTHSVNGVAVSANPAGIAPISQQSTIVLASLAYHDYEGIALRDDEKPRLVKDLGDRTFLMLRNHGLLTVASSIPDAFLAMYVFEQTCRIQVLAQTAAAPLQQVDPRIVAGAKDAAALVMKSLGGALAWPGLLRKLDRLDPSFRT